MIAFWHTGTQNKFLISRSVIGSTINRIRVDKNGDCWRTDMAGGLNFRFQGEKKEILPQVTELGSIKKQNDIFGDITDSEINNQIKDILQYEKDYIDYLENKIELKDIKEGNF